MLTILLAVTTYAKVQIEGWTVQVDQPWMKSQPAQWVAVRRELESQFYQIRRAVPAPALAKLRQVVVWVHPSSPETKCAAYHPGAGWLREHAMNPAMEKGIEIGSAENFLSWTRHQPWMILHEMAHAYHHQFLPQGFENPDLKSAFDRAMKAKSYEEVRHWNGGVARHYATSNPMEFFAEASEAYFGQNDFFPFVRAELKNHDGATYELVARLWEIRS